MQTVQRLIADFVVVGIPKGEPRARATVRGGHAHIYSSDVGSEWKYQIRGALLDQMAEYHQWPIFNLGEPVGLTVTFYMPRPKSHYVAGDRKRPLKESAPIWHTSKPDTDNLIKSVADCLGPWPRGSEGLLWSDDQQVCAMEAVKVYTPEGQEPGARITAMHLNPELHPDRSHED